MVKEYWNNRWEKGEKDIYINTNNHMSCLIIGSVHLGGNVEH